MDAEEKQRFAALAKAVAERRDQQAFSVLFDYFAPRLKSWLLRQRMPATEAEELVHALRGERGTVIVVVRDDAAAEREVATQPPQPFHQVRTCVLHADEERGEENPEQRAVVGRKSGSHHTAARTAGPLLTNIRPVGKARVLRKTLRSYVRERSVRRAAHVRDRANDAD